MMPAIVFHPLFAVALWLSGSAALAVISIEHLFGELAPAAMQIQAKVVAYLTAAVSCGVHLTSLALMGSACAMMLRWLEAPLPGKDLARAIGAAFWTYVAHAWLMVGMVWLNPPEGVSLETLMAAADQEPDEAVGIAWIVEMQYAATAGFLAALFILLSRSVAWLNALIATAFGAAAVAAIGTGLNRLVDVPLN